MEIKDIQATVQILWQGILSDRQNHESLGSWFYGLHKWTFLLAVEVIKTDLSVCLFVGTLTAEPFDLSRNLEFILLVCLFVMR